MHQCWFQSYSWTLKNLAHPLYIAHLCWCCYVYLGIWSVYLHIWASIIELFLHLREKLKQLCQGNKKHFKDPWGGLSCEIKRISIRKTAEYLLFEHFSVMRGSMSAVNSRGKYSFYAWYLVVWTFNWSLINKQATYIYFILKQWKQQGEIV